LLSGIRRHTTSKRDWSSDVCSSDLELHRKRPVIVGLMPNGLAVTADGGNGFRPDAGAVHDGKRRIRKPVTEALVQSAQRVQRDEIRRASPREGMWRDEAQRGRAR